MEARIYIDGGARGNPGPAAAGIVILAKTNDTVIVEAGLFLGKMTNNVAEYHGLMRALQAALKLGIERAEIFSDSELMVRQLTGEYRVKAPTLKPLYAQAVKQLSCFSAWRIEHIRREKNQQADALVNDALDAKRDVIRQGNPTYWADGTDKSPQDQNKPHWTVELRPKGRSTCILDCPVGKLFDFGPWTPAGLCVFAVEAVFAKGPQQWHTHGDQGGKTQCPRCGLDIHINVIGDI